MSSHYRWWDLLLGAIWNITWRALYRGAVSSLLIFLFKEHLAAWNTQRSNPNLPPKENISAALCLWCLWMEMTLRSDYFQILFESFFIQFCLGGSGEACWLYTVCNRYLLFGENTLKLKIKGNIRWPFLWDLSTLFKPSTGRIWCRIG